MSNYYWVCDDLGNSQRKSTAMFDSDDDSSVTSSSSARSDMMSVYGEEVQFDQDSLLDQALDALDEKRYFTCPSQNLHAHGAGLLRF